MEPSDAMLATLSLLGEAPRRRGYLLVVQEDSSSAFPLPDRARVLIGRIPEAEVKLRDAACSRRHAVLHVADEGVHLQDLGSHNGTRVNGRTVHDTVAIASGDVLTIGKVVIVVHLSSVERPSGLVDATALRERCEQELERAVRYDRPVSVAILRFATAPESYALHRILAAELVPPDRAARLDDGDVMLLFPERDPGTAREIAEHLVAAAQPLGGDPRAGVASCPGDGCRCDLLLSAARAAVTAASPGATLSAGEVDARLPFSDRTVLVADPAMVHLFDLMRRLAASDLPVLIAGETGVGKENAAYALHAWSRRKEQRFVALNCAALHADLVESELFGHERGAFSGAVGQKIGLLESADGGTLFLDEIGELPLSVQAKLLRALETRRLLRVGSVKELEIDVRIVAATNRDLGAEVAAGRFRRDLLYRVSGAAVTLPPLRDRPREIALFARQFMDEARAAHGLPSPLFSAAAMEALAQHEWPGNVRELKNEMAYVAATLDGALVEPWHLSERVIGTPEAGEVGPPEESPSAPGSEPLRPIADELRDLERARMAQALEAAGGVQKRAAELIAMPIRTFRMKAKQYGMDRPRR